MSDDTQPLRRCWHCGERKPLAAFYTDPKRRTKCRECSRAYLREYKRERVEYLRQYKLERGCMDCGFDAHWVALELDHRPGEVKLFMPSRLAIIGSWQQMLDEVAKCDVVCSNCHQIRTHERNQSSAAGWDLRKREKTPTGPYSEDRDQLPLFPIDPAA